MSGLSAEGLQLTRGDFSLGPISFSVGAGQALLIFGASLSGKTSLLKALVGLIPARGQVRARTQSRDLSAPGDWHALRSQVGMVFQNDALFDSLSVRENIAEPLRRAGISDADIRITQALSDVGLTEAADKLPEQLSGGMRKRAGLARALATQAPVLLVDEPLAGLDPGTQKRIAELLARARDDGHAVIIAVADPAPVSSICAQALALDGGRVHAFGETQRVVAESAPLRDFNP